MQRLMNIVFEALKELNLMNDLKSIKTENTSIGYITTITLYETTSINIRFNIDPILEYGDEEMQYSCKMLIRQELYKQGKVID